MVAGPQNLKNSLLRLDYRQGIITLMKNLGGLICQAIKQIAVVKNVLPRERKKLMRNTCARHVVTRCFKMRVPSASKNARYAAAPCIRGRSPINLPSQG
jgi:hypothetical protein